MEHLVRRLILFLQLSTLGSSVAISLLTSATLFATEPSGTHLFTIAHDEWHLSSGADTYRTRILELVRFQSLGTDYIIESCIRLCQIASGTPYSTAKYVYLKSALTTLAHTCELTTCFRPANVYASALYNVTASAKERTLIIATIRWSLYQFLTSSTVSPGTSYRLPINLIERINFKPTGSRLPRDTTQPAKGSLKELSKEHQLRRRSTTHAQNRVSPP